MTGSVGTLLELIGTSKDFVLRGGLLARLRGRTASLRAVQDVSLKVMQGEIIGLVGDSGSGKSTVGRIIVGLIEPSAGAVMFHNREVKNLRGRALATHRRRSQMVFQDTGSSLNPRKRIGTTLHEALAARGVARSGRHEELERLLGMCGLSTFVIRRYPHELSGGQRQRVGIARALAMQPELLVDDAPVSALDVSLHGQITNLLTRLNAELGLTLIFISHDLAVVRRICSRIGVMYAGRIVGQGSPDTLLTHPAHPYTRALIDAVPRGLAGRGRVRDGAASKTDAGYARQGCSFRPRCRAALLICETVVPPVRAIGPRHEVACHAA
jgi:peptide/nickel transport system ATP-binding protein